MGGEVLKKEESIPENNSLDSLEGVPDLEKKGPEKEFDKQKIEAAFVEDIESLGAERSRKLLEALKKLSSTKKHGESFQLGDALAENKKTGVHDAYVDDIIHGWVFSDRLYGKRGFDKDINIRSLEVSRAIEILESIEKGDQK